MSDILYNKVEGYKKDGWVKYCTHDETQIKGFFGDFRFLSNFEPCNVFGYPSVENAYMAAKVIVRARGYFKTCSATEAKKNWRQFELFDKNETEWNARKFDVMALLVFEKFRIDKTLREKLLNTGDKYLEETNWWKDVFWGVDIKLGGENNLGQILMGVRDFWKRF